MKKALSRIAFGASVLAAAALTVVSPAGAATVSPAKICEYENGAQCTGWYPNSDTCRGIANYGTDYQIKACAYWKGVGTRG